MIDKYSGGSVSTYLDGETKQRLIELAEKEDVSVTSIVKKAVLLYMKDQG